MTPDLPSRLAEIEDDKHESKKRKLGRGTVGKLDRAEPRGEMSLLERLSATVDILGTYKRGINVGYARATEQVIDWMVSHGYPVGEDDSLNTLLFELERMASGPSPPTLPDKQESPK